MRGAIERHGVKLCDISLMATPAAKGSEAVVQALLIGGADGNARAKVRA